MMTGSLYVWFLWIKKI